jgi:tRNA(Ile)-lysidine synthase
MSGHKKVQDLFCDRKVPAEQRRLVPLITDGEGEIIWVVGCAMSERARLTEGTREFLRIRVKE